ncbi:FimV family protein [Chitinimonas sp.]|uniref:type IV pilus assembly protein FimV n=1 Tax=Chitinimonas sp. TaxID=1934313 RepID=UPI0035AE7981
MSYHRAIPYPQLLIASLLASTAHAATLGEVQLSSWLGQALSARIRVNGSPEENLRRECFSAVLHEGDNEGVMRRVVLDYTEEKNGGWLQLLSDGAINEPILALSIKVRCGSGVELRRDYTVFLDPLARPPRLERTVPAAASSNPQRLAAAPAPTDAGSDYLTGDNDSLLRIAQQRYPGKPDSAKLYALHLAELNPGIGQVDARLPPASRIKLAAALQQPAHPLAETHGSWTVAPGESFFGIVRKIYPDQPARKKALVALMRSLNPDLPANGEVPLPAGTQLRLPARLDQALDAGGSKPPADILPRGLTTLARPKTMAPPSPPPAAAPAPDNKDRLIVSSPSTPTRPPRNEVEQLQQRETSLTDQLAEQTARMNEAQFRIEKLEKHLAWLNEQLAKRERAEQLARSAATSKSGDSGKNNWLALAAAGGIGAAVAALLAVLMRRSGRPRNDEQAERLAQSLRDNHESMMWDELDTTPAPLKPARQAMPPEQQGEPSAADMDVVYLNNIASEAAVLASNGQYDKAVSILADEIDARPTQVVNWMQLLELYHGHREPEAFVELAQRFRERFASQALWAKVAAMGAEIAPGHALFRRSTQPLSSLDNADALTAILDAAPKAPAVPASTTAPAAPGQPAMPAISAASEPAHPAPIELEPLMFELELPPAVAPAELIDVPPVKPGPVDLAPIERHAASEPAVSGSLAQAQNLIKAGERERGAMLLEQIMMSGTLDERIAAAELLVRLTSPDQQAGHFSI